MKQSREDKEESRDNFPKPQASAINLLRAAVGHGGSETVGDGMPGKKLAKAWMLSTFDGDNKFQADMDPFKAVCLANLSLGLEPARC